MRIPHLRGGHLVIGSPEHPADHQKVTVLLDRLWAVARKFGATLGVDAEGAFEDAGLLLDRRGLTGLAWDTGYRETPPGSVTFAHTGGDGVHFGLIPVGGTVGDGSSVVMTTPAYPPYRLVVGRDLTEFLALGCRAGYYALESLPDLNARTVKAVQDAPPAEPDSCEGPALLALTTAFDLQPWPDVRTRLAELQGGRA